MQRSKAAGFSLIELLVVIGIISLLMVALVPRILAGRETANRTADAANMRNVQGMVRDYHERKKHYPPGGGYKFLLGPWVDKMIPERTPRIRDMYFTPGLEDSHLIELRQRDVKDIWRSWSEVDSRDTHYAGPLVSEYANLRKDTSVWMANDNEYGPAFVDGTIQILMGDGTIQELLRPDLMAKYGWPEDDDEYTYPVGPESPHPLLQKVTPLANER